MDIKSIFKHVDHTLLAPCSTWKEIQALCEEGVKYQTASVCIPAYFVADAVAGFGGKIPICTVIGFPLGYNTLESKRCEAENAIKEGADEIDMVINLGNAKAGKFDEITEEIAALKKVAQDKILKVIIETCYLNQEEKIRICRCVTEGGADYIKTSTGFGTSGAQLDDIELFKQHIGPNVKIKASGGIRTREDFEAFLNAGCDRLGTSSAVKVLVNS